MFLDRGWTPPTPYAGIWGLFERLPSRRGKGILRRMTDRLTCKRLYRSREHRVLAGVCGGLAEYFNVDPVIFRILWACAALFSAFIGAALVYVVCILAIPLRPPESDDPSRV